VGKNGRVSIGNSHKKNCTSTARENSFDYSKEKENKEIVMETQIGDIVTINVKGYHKYNGCIGKVTMKVDAEWYMVRLRDDLVLLMHETEMVKHDK
jgi:hypothetical protein